MQIVLDYKSLSLIKFQYSVWKLNNTRNYYIDISPKFEITKSNFIWYLH